MVSARESRVQPPALDGYPDIPLFNTKAVVRQTGAPAPTLRAWERRYGILAPRRGKNGYRLYSERDIAVVAWLRDQIESGLTISQAIALLRSLDAGRKRRRARGLATSIPYEPLETAAVSAPPSAAPAHPAIEPSSVSLDGLTDALIGQFLALDEAAASRTFAQAFAIYGVEEVCLRLFTPALVRIGAMWRAGEASVAVEHFAAAIVRGQLETLFRSTPASQSGPLALVGCAPDESHEIGPLTLALFLRRAGLRVAYLGQSVELDGLLDLVRAARPAWVLLSASTRPRVEALVDVGRRLDTLGAHKPALIVGGQAFARDPSQARRISGVYLSGDASTVADALRGGTHS